MIEIYFDGLCEPAYKGGPRNPGGVATYGYIIKKDDEVIRQEQKVIGEGRGMTNNVAEYSALLHALEYIGSEKNVIIKGDSMLVIQQLSGNWEIRSETSRKFIPLIEERVKTKKVKYQWIPREQNNVADSLSRIAYENYLKKRDGEYQTTPESCTCPDFIFRKSKIGGKCKHILKL